MHDNLLGVFDNIELPRYVELKRQLHELQSNAKMGESEYDSAILSEQPRLTSASGDRAATTMPATRATTAPIVTPVWKRR